MHESRCLYYFNRISNEKHLIINKKIELSFSAIFFDREGVLIEDKDYISNPYDVELCL